MENYITHNGDFEFYKVNGKYYDVEVVQQWLEKVLGTAMPATVDSGECMLDIYDCTRNLSLACIFKMKLIVNFRAF